MKHIRTLEEWRDIKGYEGIYQVSDLGRVRSLDRIDRAGKHRKERILTPQKSKDGYLRVELDNKSYSVNRLVLMAFCPVEGMESLHCDHIDFNPSNNRLFNLRWLEPRENIARHKTGFANGCKAVRCIETGIIYSSISEAAKAINRAISSLSACLNGKSKTCGGFHWEFVEVNE